MHMTYLRVFSLYVHVLYSTRACVCRRHVQVYVHDGGVKNAGMDLSGPPNYRGWKMQDWIHRDLLLLLENAGLDYRDLLLLLENAGLDLSGTAITPEKCRTGSIGTTNYRGWKMQDWIYRDRSGIGTEAVENVGLDL